ncbi:MAG: hypothetical protein LBN32_02790 [Helicobacteraceae bacterium]|jgi:hypothetical protein|nr:hypothetical protein [Helicobacteraceae bacterium]
MSLELDAETLDDNSRLKNWLEYDYNPFFVFSQNGSAIYLNRSAELLSGYEPIKTFNDLALSYASIDFGYKTTFMPLSFGKFHFFAITVGYEDENVIGIKLYQSPSIKENTVEKIKNYDISNIYVLIDIAIMRAKSRLGNTTQFRNEFDPAIPEFKLSQNDFIKVLRKVYDCFDANCAQIVTTIKFKVGEFLYANGNKYPLVEMIINGFSRNTADDSTIYTLASNVNISASFEKDAVILEVPIVT